MALRQNASSECKTPNTYLTRGTKQSLRKHGAQPPLRNQQQPFHTVQVTRHRAQRILFKMKPKVTWENGLQLPQARLKPEKESGLSDHGIDEIRTCAACFKLTLGD
jgi:hypothetical protein